jgi:photosystem II stability/assembly factor-like uncharacterized protein
MGQEAWPRTRRMGDIKASRRSSIRVRPPITCSVTGASAGALAAYVLGKILEIAPLLSRIFTWARSRPRTTIASGLGKIVSTRLLSCGLWLLTCLLLIVAAPVSFADDLKEISFRDKIFDIAIRGNDVFAVGFPGIMLHSSDRGEHFVARKLDIDDALFSIDMAADGTGALVGRGGLLLTTSDGGKSWTKRETGTRNHLFSVAVVDGGKIWAVGHFGAIVHSADGGKSWTAQKYDPTFPALTEEEDKALQKSDEITAEEENEGEVEYARLNSVTFTDARKGWITGEFGLVLHTEDGGATWKRQRSNVSILMFEVKAIDDKRLVVVGSEGSFIETDDGGLNWRRIDTGASENLLCVSFAGNRYVVAGWNGLLLVREGPSGSFKRIPTGLYSWLGSVAFLDDRLGFVAGGRGYLLKTTDGGMSWNRLAGK